VTRQLVYTLDDILAVADAIHGEGRGCSIKGKRAIAHTVRNRCLDRRWPNSPRKVCRQRVQFSALNRRTDNVGNLHAIVHADFDDEAYRDAFWIAAKVLASVDEDLTGGANHYHGSYMRKFPKWSKPPAIEIGRIGYHVFYKL